jgi:hypothetical protein
VHPTNPMGNEASRTDAGGAGAHSDGVYSDLDESNAPQGIMPNPYHRYGTACSPVSTEAISESWWLKVFISSSD